VDHEPVLVDQVVLHQRVYQHATASNQNVLTGLLLQPGYFFRYITLDQS